MHEVLPALPRNNGREAIGQLVSIGRLKKAGPTLPLLPREEAIIARLNPTVLTIQTCPNLYSSLLVQSRSTEAGEFLEIL